MQPAAWPIRDAQIIERQSALLERIIADRARALARSAEADAQLAGRGAGAQPPRVRQIDLLTGEQWPRALSDASRPAGNPAAGPTTRGRPGPELPLLPRVRTQMPAEIGLTAAAPSWLIRPPTAAPNGSPRSGGAAPESPLDAAPGDYLCPISHEIMLDPVLIETGCTFEREALRRWWAQSEVPRCPLTGVAVQHAVMAPADELRRQIRAWALRNGVDLRTISEERLRAAAADKAQQSEQVLLQPAGQAAATSVAPKAAKAGRTSGKASKKGRGDGAARRSRGCCCCCRSSEVLE